MNFLSRQELDVVCSNCYSSLLASSSRCDLPYPRKRDRYRFLSFAEAALWLGFEDADFLGYVLATGTVPFIAIGYGYAFERISLFSWYCSLFTVAK